MASSRLEKLGTIFSRITSLMKCGAMNPNDKPLWYEVYQAFPPIDEPSFSRRVPVKEVKPILYPEDRIRAKFHTGNYVRSLKMESLAGKVQANDITHKVILLTADILNKELHKNEDDAFKQAVEKLDAEDAFKEKPRSMFRSEHHKVKVAAVDTVNSQQTVDTSTLKNISERDVDVTSNLADSEGDRNFNRSVAKDFKDAFKNMSTKKPGPDSSSEEK